MSWNEPGGEKKDPWSGRDKDKGPPDMEDVIRSFQEKLGGIFGGGGGTGGGMPVQRLGFIGVLLLGLWLASGFYIVNQGNMGVETRFGRYTETMPAGLNWHLPVPIEQVQIVNVQQQRVLEVGYRSGGRQQALGSIPKEALMLTKDENIVDVRLAVQYQVKDAKDFEFNVFDPEVSLKQVTESAVRAVVGKSKMDFVLKEGRTEVAADILQQIQGVMDSYQSGVSLSSVNLQDAQPPEEVQSAFEDAIKAREDKQRLINEAEAYRNGVIPEARGAAMRVTQEAEGYTARVVARAYGETRRFSQLLAEYKKAPAVTRRRLYIEAMEDVLENTDTVMVDVKGGNNLLYLPLDKLGGMRGSSTRNKSSSRRTVTPEPAVRQTAPLRSSSRGRDVRGR